MIQLSVFQYDMVERYTALLDTVEQAFEYVVEGFDDFERTQGDQVLEDIFSAFTQIVNTNENLIALFSGEKDILHNLEQFNAVIKEVEKLEGSYENPILKQQVITQSLFPAYQAWKLSIQKPLSKYTSQ
ncbi:hypothetical protein IM538_21165 [Cytobacillus suaedae]|nr:hypothetical protein IM538_21165 [Cytobacillus suaedae]